MPLIRTTVNGKRTDINTASIRKVIDNGQGKPATIVYNDGDEDTVEESAQSVRGYVKKAEAAVNDTAEA